MSNTLISSGTHMGMTCLFVAPRAVNELRALHWRSAVVAQVDHRIGGCLECVVDRLRRCTRYVSD
ncbi:hypothetical protein PCAR4_350014 [Paraburkholderia caribensis]|nr:hypothetical protein PCAR4_350014 [Paraburkholderia caribensis]